MASRRPPDDSGGDDSSSSDESDEDDAATLLNRQVALATYETVAALGVQRQTPSELSSARRE